MLKKIFKKLPPFNLHALLFSFAKYPSSAESPTLFEIVGDSVKGAI